MGRNIKGTAKKTKRIKKQSKRKYNKQKGSRKKTSGIKRVRRLAGGWLFKSTKPQQSRPLFWRARAKGDAQQQKAAAQEAAVVAQAQQNAEQGDAGAQYILGDCYYKGEGVDQSVEDAVKWWEKGAEMGNADAQYSLGFCYENGEGVEQDFNKADRWFTEAVNQGHEAAKNNMEKAKLLKLQGPALNTQAMSGKFTHDDHLPKVGPGNI